MAPQLDLTLADPQQVIEEQVAVVDLQPQDVVLLSQEVGELLLPPGIHRVPTDRSLPQTGRTTEHLHVAVSGPEQV